MVALASDWPSSGSTSWCRPCARRNQEREGVGPSAARSRTASISGGSPRCGWRRSGRGRWPRRTPWGSLRQVTSCRLSQLQPTASIAARHRRERSRRRHRRCRDRRCALAAFLAEAGASVLLVERDDVAAAASGRNSGLLQHPMDAALVPLFEESLEHYRRARAGRLRTAARASRRARARRAGERAGAGARRAARLPRAARRGARSRRARGARAGGRAGGLPASGCRRVIPSVPPQRHARSRPAPPPRARGS